MELAALPWLDGIVSLVAGGAVALLVLLNGAFALGVLMLRDRGFVNRWTKSLVVADTVLLAAAVGAPVMGVAAKLGLQAVGLLTAAPVAAATAATTK